MKTQITQNLVCPKCRGKIEPVPFKQRDKEIKEGLLLCQGKCKNQYPIINYIPRFRLKIRSKDKQCQQVKTSFANKWLSQPRWGIYQEYA